MRTECKPGGHRGPLSYLFDFVEEDIDPHQAEPASASISIISNPVNG